MGTSRPSVTESQISAARAESDRKANEHQAPYYRNRPAGLGAYRWFMLPIRCWQPEVGDANSEQAAVNNEIDYHVDPDIGLKIGKNEWPLAAHALAIRFHHFQRGTDIGREVDFIDHQ